MHQKRLHHTAVTSQLVFQVSPISGVQSIHHTSCGAASLNTHWIMSSNTSRVSTCLWGSLNLQQDIPALYLSPALLKPRSPRMPSSSHTGAPLCSPSAVACCIAASPERACPSLLPPVVTQGLRTQAWKTRVPGSDSQPHQSLALTPWLSLFLLWFDGDELIPTSHGCCED